MELVSKAVDMLENESGLPSDEENARSDTKSKKRGYTLVDMFPSSSAKLPKFKKRQQDQATKSKKNQKTQKIVKEPGKATVRPCLVGLFLCFEMLGFLKWVSRISLKGFFLRGLRG